MLTVALVLACAQQPAPEPLLGTFPLDPVALLRDGRETRGRDEFAAVHANWRYLFASDAERAAFLAKPEDFALQLGGACARMGALSPAGRPEIFAVADGRLYLFASEACRATFLQDPSKVLEPDQDPDFASTPAERAAGAALLARAVEWIGGAERLDRATVLFSRQQESESGGVKHYAADALLLAPGGCTRRESAKDADFTVLVLSASDAFQASPAGVRTLHPAQRRALQRRHHRDVIGLLQARALPGFVAASPGPGRLLVRFDGTTQELEVDPASGEITSQTFTGWSSNLMVGRAQRRFRHWQLAGGVRVPTAWDLEFDGKPDQGQDFLAAGYALAVLEAPPAKAFARP